MSCKKIVFVDMDGVLVNFEKAMNDYHKTAPEHLSKIYAKDPDIIPGIFREAEPMPGAIQAIKQLHQSGKYNDT